MLYHLPVSCTQSPLSPSWAQMMFHPSAPTSPSPGQSLSLQDSVPGSSFHRELLQLLATTKPRNKEIRFMTCLPLPLGISFLFSPSPWSVTGLPGSEVPFPSIWGCEEGSGHWVQHSSFQSSVWSQQCEAPEGNCQPWRAAVLGSPLQHIPNPVLAGSASLHSHQLPGVAVSPRTFQGRRDVGDTSAQQPLFFCGPGLGSLLGRGSHGPD